MLRDFPVNLRRNFRVDFLFPKKVKGFPLVKLKVIIFKPALVLHVLYFKGDFVIIEIGIVVILFKHMGRRSIAGTAQHSTMPLL